MLLPESCHYQVIFDDKVDRNALVRGDAKPVEHIGLLQGTKTAIVFADPGLKPGQVPHASIATRITMQLGGAFGAAVFALILQTQLAAQAAGGLVGRATAFDNAFWWSIGLTALAIIPALFLPGRREVASIRAEQAQKLATQVGDVRG